MSIPLETNAEMRSDSLIESKKRRSILLGLTAIIGSAGASKMLGGDAFGVAMAYQRRPDGVQGAGRLFTDGQMQILREVCQLVIPKTDTPGAADLDTHGFIDNQLVRCHRADEQLLTVKLLKLIDSSAHKQFKKSFIQSSEQQQLALLSSIENAKNGFLTDDAENFAFLKRLIVFGYFTTEVGATQELAYLPVPGGFKGSIPYSTINKAWFG